MDLCTQWGKERVRRMEKGTNICTPSGVRRLAGEKSVYGTGSPVWCSVMTWRDGMGRGGSLEKEGMYVELWLIQVVWQRPTQPCKKRFAIKMITKKKWECCLWGDINEWGDRNKKRNKNLGLKNAFLERKIPSFIKKKKERKRYMSCFPIEKSPSTSNLLQLKGGMWRAFSIYLL